MKTAAPGKLLLSGAYVVLEGGPAIVCAVSRHVYAFGSVEAHDTTAEVAAALDVPCAVDTRELEDGGKKLGLGSSAAAVVAGLALRAAERGEDVSSAAVRAAIFARAREAHARVQGGGSGVDVAASTFGGVLRFQRGEVAPVRLPAVRVVAFFSGSSARTSDLRGRVGRLAASDPSTYVGCMGALAACAQAASSAVEADDPKAFVDAVAGHLGALAALGAAADAPIVLPAFAELGGLARNEHAAFIPSGAGGGDVGVFVGMEAPSPSFMQRAEALSMKRLPLSIEPRGVRISE